MYSESYYKKLEKELIHLCELMINEKNPIKYHRILSEYLHIERIWKEVRYSETKEEQKKRFENLSTTY